MEEMWQSCVTLPSGAIYSGVARRRIGRFMSLLRTTRNSEGAAVGIDDVLLWSVTFKGNDSRFAALTQKSGKWKKAKQSSWGLCY